MKPDAPIQGRVANQKWLDEANTLPVQATYSSKENPPEFHDFGELRTIAGEVHPPSYVIQKVSDYYKNAPNDTEE